MNNAQNKIIVAIIFGGKSAEHEISLLSAKNVYEAIDRDKFEPVLIGIDKEGRWLLNDSEKYLLNADNPSEIKLITEDCKALSLVPGRGFLASGEITKIDAAFPILHGPLGEDGTVQGLLKLANIPFVGAGVLGSAVGMDKDVMKRLLRDAKIPIGRFITLKSYEPVPSFSDVTKILGWPVFIKPANMGSSVGVSKVCKEDEYEAAVREAFNYDNKIIIEEFIQGREIECAVLGNENPIASCAGEIIPAHDFYSYKAKYLDENGALLQIPAQLDDTAAKKVQDTAIDVFKTLCCRGLARVDFFLKDDGELIVNEINTIPGFTKISMYPKLFEYSGISYKKLITRLIELALKADTN